MFRHIFGVGIFLAAILPFCEYSTKLYFPNAFSNLFYIKNKPKQLQNVDNCLLLRGLDKRYFKERIYI